MRELFNTFAFLQYIPYGNRRKECFETDLIKEDFILLSLCILHEKIFRHVSRKSVPGWRISCSFEIIFCRNNSLLGWDIPSEMTHSDFVIGNS